MHKAIILQWPRTIIEAILLLVTKTKDRSWKEIVSSNSKRKLWECWNRNHCFLELTSSPGCAIAVQVHVKISHVHRTRVQAMFGERQMGGHRRNWLDQLHHLLQPRVDSVVQEIVYRTLFP